MYFVLDHVQLRGLPKKQPTFVFSSDIEVEYRALAEGTKEVT